jgi:aspartyl-tRNA(Asn)/glutamyl-tRNA(Gln) amidotransferase subunit A
MTEPFSWTLTTAAKHLASGEISSAELVASLLKRIDEVDPHLGAYVHLDRDPTLAAAAAADQRRARGEGGAMEGLPIAIKDVLNVIDQPCTCGSRILEGYRAPYDATAVARLRAQGAIPMGRVNMDEFAMGSSNESSAFGPTRNPWDGERVPGGSSGGSAAAVSADLALAALGTDTGGSIRQPAAFCGCVGLKPSYGRVSRYGLTAYASSLDQIGPVTKTVEDAAWLLEALAGHDAYDSTSVRGDVPTYRNALTGDLKGLRLGLPREYFIEGMDPEVETRVREAVSACEKLGAEIVEVSLPRTRYAVGTYYIIATAEASANLARFDGIRYGARVEGEDAIDVYGKTRSRGFGPEVKRRIILGTYVLSSGYYDAYYLRAQKVRTLIRNDFVEAFKTCDALLTPVAPTAAYRLGEHAADPLKMYLGDIFTVTANLAGICGLSVPCGLTAEGLPVGLQILGPGFGEETILRIGHAYEQAHDWWKAKPDLARGGGS